MEESKTCDLNNAMFIIQHKTFLTSNLPQGSVVKHEDEVFYVSEVLEDGWLEITTFNRNKTILVEADCVVRTDKVRLFPCVIEDKWIR